MGDQFEPDPETLRLAAEASAKFIQGSVLAKQDISSLVNPEHPLTRAAGEFSEDEDSANVVLVEYDWVMVATQTCDLARTPRGKYTVVICPVVEMQPRYDGNKIKGAQPQFIYLPWHHANTSVEGNVWAADLRYVTTVEKSVLIGAQEQSRPPNEHRRELASRIARLFDRPAIPDDVVERLSGLSKVARTQHSKQNSAGSVLRNFRQIRVLPTPDYDRAPPYELTILFIVDEHLLDPAQVTQPEANLIALPVPGSSGLDALAEEIGEADYPIDLAKWVAAASELVAHVTAEAPVSRAVGKVVTALTPNDVANSDVLDFEYLSGNIR